MTRLLSYPLHLLPAARAKQGDTITLSRSDYTITPHTYTRRQIALTMVGIIITSVLWAMGGTLL